MLQPSVTLVLVHSSVINKIIRHFYVHNNLCMFINDSNIKDLNLHMHTNHIINSCLQKNIILLHVSESRHKNFNTLSIPQTHLPCGMAGTEKKVSPLFSTKSLTLV